MHTGMPRQSLKPFTHIDQGVHLLVFLIQFTKFGILFQCEIKRDVQFIRHHLCNRIRKRIRQIHNSRHIPDNTLRRQRTEGDDLNHLLRTVLPAHIIDDILSSVRAEVDVDIGHGDTFGIQEAFKQQVVADRVNVRDL